MTLKRLSRREFLKASAFVVPAISLPGCLGTRMSPGGKARPNLVFILADQWRAQSTGYAGNTDIQTSNLDGLSGESVKFTTAVSGCPVCSPYRASLLTGQYWLTHGIFYNDKPLSSEATSIAQAYNQAGYDTGYIGKWHLNGHDKNTALAESRQVFIPKDRRQGFGFWRACECTHDYNNSLYYADTDERLYWNGYDAIAQTQEAIRYIREHKSGSPFALFLSWGPPHDPYHTAPQKYQERFNDLGKLTLRPNVPAAKANDARKDLAGYYAHIAALDDCVGKIVRTLQECNIEDNTIVVFTSDHGDMLYSQGQTSKQRPWDESILVPFLLRYPAKLGNKGKVVDVPINTPDIMPTILGLSSVDIPQSCEGKDYSAVITSAEKRVVEKAALIMCPVPFHQWNYKKGGREYRGVRTKRHTYVRDIKGPWLLYDNDRDPYQLTNLCCEPKYRDLRIWLDKLLNEKLEETNDRFLTGQEYMRLWDYEWDRDDAPIKT